MQQAGIQSVAVTVQDLLGKITADKVLAKNGEEIVPLNHELDEDAVQSLLGSGVKEFPILFIDNLNVDASFRNTLVSDKVSSHEEAILEIYKRLRPGDPPTIEPAQALFDNLFFNADRYDLSAVGRLKLNERLGLEVPIETRTLTKEDILRTVSYLLDLKQDRGVIDDIDHLGNRRVRAVGELLENQYRIGC